MKRSNEPAFQIIPAIDLKGGKCVRLRQGRDDASTEYSSDPVEVAHEWFSQGARRLHVVNLDGAFGRTSDNLNVVARMADTVDMVIEFGGGLRSMEDIVAAFDAGVDKVVLGTVAIENPALLAEIIPRFGSGNIIVALDAVDGKVATRGWVSVSDADVCSAASALEKAGVEEILYTDIHRDGMLTGPDYATLGQLAAGGLRIIASGGIASTADVLRLAAMRGKNIVGAIVGKALYEKHILLPDVLQELRTLC